MRTFVRTITLKSYHWFSELQNENDEKVTKISKMFHYFRTNFGLQGKKVAFSVQIFWPNRSTDQVTYCPQEISRVCERYRMREVVYGEEIQIPNKACVKQYKFQSLPYF